MPLPALDRPAPSALRDGIEAYRRYVNPLVTARAELLAEPVEVTGTADGQLVGADGPVEDFHGTQSFGHRNPVVTAALQRFLASDEPNWFPSRVNPWAGRLARALCERSARTLEGPRPAYDNVFFANSGSGAVEAAIKLARAATRRPGIIAIDGAYHGCTMGSCALMKAGMFRDRFAPHLPGVVSLARGDIDGLARLLAGGDIAALVMEPIQLEGGVHAQPPEFIAAACELTARHGTLLVADEIQTGLGRTGRFLASEVWPRRPDAVVLGKHLGGGITPISAMMTRGELFARAYGEHHAAAEAHNTTFGGHALACVAGLAVLDLLTDDIIAGNAARGARLRGQLERTLAHHALFEEVRGAGVLIGIALRATDHPWLTFEHFGAEALSGQPTIGVIACHRMYRRGFYCFACGHDWRILRVLPRFDIPDAVLDRFVAALDEELTVLGGLV